MNWMSLAVGLAREAMKSGPAEPEPLARPTDLGTALAQQFSQIDRNLDVVVRMINAHNKKLEATIRRQRIWNIALAAGLVVAVAVALLK